MPSALQGGRHQPSQNRAIACQKRSEETEDMNELREQESGVFIVADDAPLFVVPFDRDGKEEVLYATDDAAADRALGLDKQRERINLAGVWSHLDWDGAEAYLERIDSE